ncbi:MAG: rod shape-determining protein RodA [Thermotoga sp.]|nr:MAG: rod shape-determining protein RodA [Thermotoga sp.]
MMRRIDPFFTFLLLAIAIFGLIVLKSAVIHDFEFLFKRQIIWDTVGFVVFFILSFIKFDRVNRLFPLGYVISIILLIVVLKTSEEIFGSKRWLHLPFGAIQPSEIAKLMTVGVLSNLLSRESFKRFILSFLVVIFPFILVFLEPDLGTAIIFPTVWFLMLYVSKYRRRYIYIPLVSILIITPIAFNHLLMDYQRERIMAFLMPEKYSASRAYQMIQSMRAIGSGMLFGRGYMMGPFNLYGYIPVNHSDFIFSTLAEEFGFLGSVVLIILYGLILSRMYRHFSRLRNDRNKLFICGFTVLLSIHALYNMGMCLGILPVAGLPLPLVAYGGTSTFVFLSFAGMVNSVISDHE